MGLALVLGGCGGRETEADRAVHDGMLLVGNGTEPKTIDPHLNIGSAEGNIISALSEGLVVQDPDDSFAVRPGVAESWTHNADFTRWTFKLRDDARWSDGTKLDAEDFVYSFHRILTPELGAETADLFSVIKGAKAYNRGEITDFAEVGIKALAPDRLELRMDAPTPYLLPMLAGFPFAPVNRAAVESGGDPADRSNRWADAGSYVGNGPFVITEWRINQYITLERNPQYWDAKNVRLNAIRFFPIENQKTEMNAFLSGRLHVTHSVMPDQIASLRASNPDRVVSDPQLGSSYYMFNVTRKPFDDPRLREALSLVIDRQLLVDKVAQGGQAPLGGLVPPGMPDYKSIEAMSPDIPRARRLLAEAGYPEGKGFPEASILINTAASNRTLAEAIQAMWKDNLGIDVGIQNQEWKVYLDSTLNADFQIARAGWIAPYFDPAAFLDMMTTGSPNNNMRWSNPEFDALIAEAKATGNVAKHMALLHKAEVLMMKEHPIIPLFTSTHTYLLDPRVKGWGHSLNDSRSYKFMSLAGN